MTPIRNRPCVIVLLPLLLAGGSSLAGNAQQRLSFVASYQGLLTAGANLQIANLELSIKQEADGSESVEVTLSTREHEAAEFFLPVRFCYRNQLLPETGSTLRARWWSRIGNKAHKGELVFDEQRRQVIRRYVKAEQGDSENHAEDWSRPVATRENERAIKYELDKQAFPKNGWPMDQLSMIRWLSGQNFKPGQEILLPTKNGETLDGFRVLAEAFEDIDWHGRSVPSIRLRLEPQVNKDGKHREPTWLWLSRDRGLPLRFRSDRAFGHFQLQLLPKPRSEAMNCRIPEALALPDFNHRSGG